MNVTGSPMMELSRANAKDCTASPTASLEKAVQQISGTFVINLDQGLHARPCALLVSTLAPFGCEVLVEANGGTASGNSIIGLLMLSAGPGTPVKFSITGARATDAMNALERLFETGFHAAFAV